MREGKAVGRKERKKKRRKEGKRWWARGKEGLLRTYKEEAPLKEQ